MSRHSAARHHMQRGEERTRATAGGGRRASGAAVDMEQSDMEQGGANYLYTSARVQARGPRSMVCVHALC